MAKKKPWQGRKFEFPQVECPVCERTIDSIMMAGHFLAGDEVICMRCWTEKDQGGGNESKAR